MPVLNQPAFASGEVTPSLYGRVDLDTYRSGLARAQNFMVNFHGGVSNRPGMRFLDPAKFNNKTVLIPFQFSTIQTYMLEVGDQYIRVISNGGYLFDGPAKVEIATPYLADELSQIGFTQSADVLTLFHRNHPIGELKRFSNTDWRYEVFGNTGGPFETLNIDETKSMYASDQSGSIVITSNFDVFNANHVGKLLTLDQQATGEVRTWIQRMEVAVGDKIYNAGGYYEATDAPTVTSGSNSIPAQTGDIPPTHLTGEIWDGPGEVLPDDERAASIGVKWRYLHSGFGVARIDSIIDARNVNATVETTIPESIIGGTIADTNWDFPGETTNRVFVLSPSPTSTFVTDFEVKRLEKTTVPVAAEDTLSYPSEWTINFGNDTVTLNVDPQTEDPDNQGLFLPRDIQITQKGSVRETYKWAFEPWRDDSGYPQCGSYYQQRIATASTLQLPQTLWLSRVDSFPDFSRSRPLLADDSMRFDVNSLQVNEIHNLVPLDGLLVFTRGGVFAINRGGDQAITPETPPSIPLQTYDGAEPIRPIATASTVLYIEDGGKIVRDLEYQFGSNSFQGVDLTVRATHLFEQRKIVSWAYAKKPLKVIWCVFDDGTMAALTYLKEQQVWGWAPQITDGLVKWVAAIPESSNDAIYIVVEREGVTMVERLDERRKIDDREAFFVDSGLTYDGRNKTDTTLTITAAVYEAFEPATLTASASYFDAGMVGRTFQFWVERTVTGTDQNPRKLRNFYEMIVTSYASPTSVEVELNVAIPEELQNTPSLDWAFTASEISGLDHLEGKTVSIYADSAVVVQQQVASGAITLEQPAGVVSVGLPYRSLGQTLDVELAQPPETYRNKRKVVNKVFMQVRDTSGLLAGTRLDSLESIKQRDDDDFYGSAPGVENGTIEIDTTGEWNRPGRVYFIQDDPLPCEILSVMPEFAVSETN